MYPLTIYYLEDNHENFHELEIKERVQETVKYLKTKFLHKFFVNENDITFKEEDIINYLKTIYSDKYLKVLQTINSNKKYIKIDQDTHLTQYSFKEIINSNALIMNAINNIFNKQIHYAYCLVRPPSHHSSCDHHSGFCMVNNTYLAAEYAVNLMKGKVLILDWDLHHGDGTENLVKQRKNENIHFISIHCYDKGFYPGTGSSKGNCRRITNYPMKKYSNDDNYFEIFEKIFMQIAEEEYKLIIISNGLDAHKDDTFSTMCLSTNFYKEVTKKIKKYKIPILYILEGGYNIDVIKDVSEQVINTLMT
jgi:acetoin utilization deacetylase AcuC-like enzyme